MNNKRIPWNKSLKQSEETKEKIRNTLIGKKLSEETKEKMKGRVPWNKGKTNIYSKETKEKMKNARLGSVMTFETKQKIKSKMTGKSKSLEHKQKLVEHLNKLNEFQTYDLNDYKEKHPFLFTIEELREHPETKNIQGRCKNHLCLNSKEQNGWFDLTKTQLQERIRQLEHPEGNDGSYFYCSDECKQICPLYKKTGIKIQTQLIYTELEYQTFRNEVLQRENYKCEYCNEQANTVHHIRTQKLEPFFSLDPDFGVACCKSCHYKYGHKDECSTGKIASKVC